ncbi:MAG: hypothetical protein AAB647_03755 [Patescibacteria group bacterium]
MDMVRAEFERKIEEFHGEPELAGMAVVSIVFTDGERHLTHTWTVQSDGEYVEYIDVHCESKSAPIRVPYRVIADVREYQKIA